MLEQESAGRKNTETARDWNKIIEWDKKYCFHIEKALSEWSPIPISSCDGAYVIDAAGNKLLDFLSGLISVNAGQRNPKIVEAIKDSLNDYGYLWEFFTTPYKSEAAKLIVEDILGPDGWAGRVHFVGSGSEANEEALQIAKLYTNRPYIITREYSYHGWTEGAAASSRIRFWRGALSSPSTSEFRPVPGFPAGGYFPAPAPFCYRCPYGYSGPEQCQVNGQVACLNELEHLILSLGPENVAAVITELVCGGSLVVSPVEWVKGLRALTKKYGILLIDDEVMAGFGRTGKWFCYQHYGIQPDIITMAKGIVSSHLPAAGVAVSKEIAQFFDKYRWWHAVTFSSHPVALAAVVANLHYMIEEDLPRQANQKGKYLEKRLREMTPKHKCVGNVSGMGLFWGIEVVRNRETREPFIKEDRDVTGAGDISNWPTTVVQQKALEKGVLLGGFVPNCLRIGPALTVTEVEIDRGIDALDYALSTLDKECV
jgi:taurine---2-oxoglutarate transaminase